MIRNTKDAYGLLPILLHWLTAGMVFFLFGLGLYMVDLSYYDSWYKAAPDLHRSVGLLLLSFLAGRIVWRLVNKPPVSLPTHRRWERHLAHAVHWLLYGLLLATILMGYLMSTADGRGIEVFGLFEVPALLGADKGREDWAGLAHEILAWVIMGLVALHIGGALKHHFLDKDATLRRMILPERKKTFLKKR